MAADRNEAQCMQMVPHRGMIDLTEIAEGEFMISHRVTMERKALPAGRWLVEYDEDGYGCAVDESASGGDGGVVLLEELLQRCLYREPGGALVVGLEGARGNRKLVALGDLSRRNEPVKFTWLIGAARLPLSLEGVRLFWPKSGMRFFISITPLYSQLRLDSYKGFPSKWFYQSKKAWQQSLARWGFEHHILASASNQSEEHLVKSQERFLATPAVSLLAFLHLLVTWSTAPAPLGGLRAVESRSIASEVLGGLLRCVALQNEGIVVRLDFEEGWKCIWPCPRPMCKESVQLTIGEDCLVDLSPWQEFLIREAPLQRHCSRSWWRLTQTVVDADLRAPLTELLAIMRKNGGGCYAQLLMGVSRGMDKMANKLCQNPDSDTINFRVQFASGMVAGLDSQQAYSIARYVNSAQAITEDMQFCAIASDKAPVRGTNLTNSCITMVDNTCIVLPPMALSVERNFHVWEASALLVRPGYRRRRPPRSCV